MLLAIIPLLIGIGGVIWQRNSSEPISIWIIGLLVGGTILFVLLSFWAFHRVRLERDELKTTINPDEIIWAEWRKEYRTPHIPEVTQIPNTLEKMWSFVNEYLEKVKKRKRPPQIKIIAVVAELLQIDKDDPILNNAKYKSEEQMRRLTKRLRVRMGLRKRNPALEAEWRRRMSNTMDDSGIGLRLQKCPEYRELDDELKSHGKPISKSLVYHRIDEFLEDISTLHNLKLFVFYGRVSKDLQFFPRDMREFLKRLESTIERQMRGRFTEVKHVLEEYSIGGNLKNEQ